MVKAGDIVHYEVNGNKKLALVLFSHVGNRNHLGANGEPLLHLAFLAPERESERVRSNPGYVPEIFIEYDVHHISHEFSEEYKREHHAFTPAQIASRRGTSGMWQEAAVLMVEPPKPAPIEEPVEEDRSEPRTYLMPKPSGLPVEDADPAKDTTPEDFVPGEI